LANPHSGRFFKQADLVGAWAGCPGESFFAASANGGGVEALKPGSGGGGAGTANAFAILGP